MNNTLKRKRREEIENIDDLIELCDSDDRSKEITKLKRIRNSLEKLNSMIGMNSVKKNIIYQILYFLQNLNHTGDMLHTVITGPPGVGKTELSKIIAEIYSELNILPTGQIVFARRSDLVGEYLGETAIKTQDVLNNALGGVLVIDECYSLGHPEKRDSYSKECIDTINQFLTEQKDNFCCIICGYEDALKENFFSQNAGLERRFPWKYDIKEYNHIELFQIFKTQIAKEKWKLGKNAITPSFFMKNKLLFTNFGGSTEIFITKCKMAHARRIFHIIGKKNKKTITEVDISNGLELFKLNKFKEKEHKAPVTMYS
jgi:SpoVK/Ycf46/Vps4 family AAA+-type ATPase